MGVKDAIKDTAKDGAKKIGDDVTNDASSSKNDKKDNNIQNKPGDNKNNSSQTNGKNGASGKISGANNNDENNGRFGLGAKKGDLAKDVVNDITSDPTDNNNDDKKRQDNRPLKSANNLGKQAAKGIAASKLLGGVKGALAGLLLKGGILGIIKNLVGLLIKGVKAIGSFLAGLAGNIISTVTGAFGGMVAAVGSAIGVGVTAASSIVIGGITAVTIGAVGVVGVVIDGNMGKYDDYVGTDCYTKVAEAKEAVDENGDATLQENAKKAYSIFHEYGWDDNMIVGMLCCAFGEGGLDTKKIEGDYISSIKSVCEEGGYSNDFVLQNHDKLCGLVWDAYDNSNPPVSYKKEGYYVDDGSRWSGYGFIQWTAGRGEKLLNLAKNMDKNWYDFDFQMSYFIMEANTSRSAYNEAAKGKSVSECVRLFGENWGVYGRSNKADEYLSMVKSFTVDEAYAQSIIDTANQMGAQADTKAVTEANSKCSKKTATADNSSAAAAAVSMATDDYEASKYSGGASGTELYAKVVGYFHGGSTAIMDCGWFVCAAILYSGTDDNMPKGQTGSMIAYFEASEKWEKVCETSSSADEDKLQPGDVFVNANHTWMYVGEEAVLAKYPNKTGCAHASASTGGLASGRSASVNTGDYGGGSFTVYRCKSPQNSETYKNIGDGASPTKLVPLSPSM